MASEKEKLYLKLCAGYYAAFPAKPKETAQQNVNKVWNSLKKNFEDISSAVHTKLEEWKLVELRGGSRGCQTSHATKEKIADL